MIAQALGVPEEALRVDPTDGLDTTPGGTEEDQLGLLYHELHRVIVRLLQNKFHRTRRCAPAELALLIGQISKETGLMVDKVAHVAHQLASTHYKTALAAGYISRINRLDED